MSDFDKEAERKRLREKYEHEEQKREATEKMSELLLKGATMTNAHCQECGDPIFRYDGQEFCATCERAVQRDTGDADGGEGGDEDDAGPATENGEPEEIEVASPDETKVRFGGDTAEPDAGAGGDHGTQPDADAVEHSETQPDPTETVAPDETGSTANARESAPSASPDRQVPGVEPGEGGDLSNARASLSRTVASLAKQAEATTDLGQKRALLGATREAAEALSAVRDAGR